MLLAVVDSVEEDVAKHSGWLALVVTFLMFLGIEFYGFGGWNFEVFIAILRFWGSNFNVFIAILKFFGVEF